MPRNPRLTAPLAAAALLAVLALIVGCRPAAEPVAVPPAEPTGSAEPTTSAEPSGAPVALDRLTLELVRVAEGFDAPVFLTHAGDGSGRLFVVEQGGRVKVLRNGRVSPGAYLDVSDRITTGGERGLLGLAFDREFASNGRFYVNYTDGDGDTVVAAFVADDPASDTPKLTGPTQVLKVGQPYSNHNGGCIVIGPDGRLWIGMGDGGSGGDPQGNAQNPRSLLGKMLAIEIATDAEMAQRRGPATKPWGKPEVVASGLRNPWRFSFDAETGDLWIGDVGQNAWEEIGFVERDEALAGGVNHGWNAWEGTHPYPPDATPGRGGFTFPVVEYGHDEGNSVTGGYVYRGTKYPALIGTYLFADFGAGWVAGAKADGAGAALASDGKKLLPYRVLVRSAGQPSSFGEDADGELYLLDYGGTVFSVTAR